MKTFENGHFIGERALFRLEDAVIENSLFDDGESPLKEGRNLVVRDVTFGYKYPLWYGKGHQVLDCHFLPLSRSGIWYTDDSVFQRLDIEAPKEFRRCRNIRLSDIVFHDAQETLWSCDQVSLSRVKVKGDYFGMNTNNVEAEELTVEGNYAFDGSKHVHAKNCVFHTKDAFWNTEDVLLEHCVIEGEYFAWNAKKITLVDCQVQSHQGFCYMDGITLRNCQISEDSDLIFEYCRDLDAEVRGPLGSVKNPISGVLKAPSIQTLIRDDERIDQSKMRILVRKGDHDEEI